MSYTVLARRYRSRSFDEIVGQEPIARTLQNAIASSRTAHAYLFCGTRGVGKTSMARIFAKALNATDELEQSEAIGEAIFRGDDLDVIEIDGASNRGIQEARELIAGAGLSPARCRYRIYIIDEVHMLTREAFNALLKTMEEPPAHVKFILCTTEPNRVPATIQSRCQRFDFRPLPSSKIAEHLKALLEQESVQADDEVVIQIARLGQGSMRDALSLLDRLLASGEARLTGGLLEQMIGLPDSTQAAKIIDAIADADAGQALVEADRLLAGGVTVEQGLELITQRLRELMVIAACGPETDLLDVSVEARDAAAEQARRFDASGLVHLIALCDSAARNSRGSSTARALFDAVIVRMCLSEHLADLTAWLAGEGPAMAVTPAPAAGVKKKERPSIPTRPAEPPLTAATEEVLAEVKPSPIPALDRLPTLNDELWPSVLAYAAHSRSEQARLEHLDFHGIEGRTVKLSVTGAGARMARFLAGQTTQIAELIKRATDRQMVVEIDTSVATERPVPIAPEDVVEAAAAIPAVAEAMDLFDATIVSVEDAMSPDGEERTDV